MAVIELNRESFAKGLDKYPILFVDFWANWCAPCHMFATIFEAVASEHNDIAFAKVDVEKETQLAEELQISSVPHLIVFKEGIAIYSEATTLTESALRDLVGQAKAVDISELKAKLTDHG